METFVIFGQIHIHSVNGKTFDKDCVAVIKHNKPEDGRALAVEYFGLQFCMEYPQDHWDEKLLKYFPRGYVTVN